LGAKSLNVKVLQYQLNARMNLKEYLCSYVAVSDSEYMIKILL